MVSNGVRMVLLYIFHKNYLNAIEQRASFEDGLYCGCDNGKS